MTTPAGDHMNKQPDTQCRLGFVEYDGFQFCHEHLGWHHYTNRSLSCDKRPPILRGRDSHDYSRHDDWQGQQGMSQTPEDEETR